jgi:hypothetical protein
MSATQELIDRLDENGASASGSRPWSRWSRRRWLTVTAVAVAVAGVVATAALVRPSGPDVPAGALRLPDSVAGLDPMTSSVDLTTLPDWRAKARSAAPDGSLVARTYGTGALARSIRVVAAKTDLTGRLELGWVSGPGTAVGDDTCTQTVKPTANSRAATRSTLALCWRTGPDLSAYVLLVDPKHSVTMKDAAAALDRSWNLLVHA